MGVWAAAASCGCPTASFVKSSAHDGPRRSAFRVLGSAGKAAPLHAMPADVPEPSTSVVTVFAHASAPRRRELSLREKHGRRPHEIWARRSGHFSMPATALHRSESYLSVPWHLSMPRVGPWKAPRHEPASRARRPLFPKVHFYPSSEPRIRKISRTRAEGFWASGVTGFSRAHRVSVARAACTHVVEYGCRRGCAL